MAAGAAAVAAAVSLGLSALRGAGVALAARVSAGRVAASASLFVGAAAAAAPGAAALVGLPRSAAPKRSHPVCHAAIAAIATTTAAPIPQATDLPWRRAIDAGAADRCGAAVPDTRYTRIGREIFLRVC